jgi:hypothetical protein
MKSSPLLLLYLIKIIISEICNYSITCNLNENNNYCATKKRTESNNVFEISVKQCHSMPCNIYDTLLGELEKNTSCQKPPENSTYNYPSYPGGVCSSDINCLSGICIEKNNKYSCQDSPVGGECYNHNNCPLNTACINGKCQQYLGEGQKCNDSYQCQFDSFCNRHNGNKTCTKLFTIKNGENIADYVDEEERFENLCVDGGYITEEKNGKITKICEKLKNIDYDCNDNCRYRKENGSIYESEDKCLCGYNKYRTKHCVLGNGEESYIEYLNMKKQFMSNKTLTKFCHTLERDVDEICFELINTDTSVSFRNYVKNYNNKKILALQHHRLQGSESCIKEVLFNYDSSPTFSLNQTCPIFSCNNKIENCLIGFNPLQEDGKNITIDMNPISCTENEYCSLPHENEIINPSLIMERRELEGLCKIYQGQKGIKRYPGEECYINSDCISENSTCVNGICTGAGLNEKCNETKQCTVGHYCNKESKTCIKQKEEGGKCLEGWDCKNYLGCFKGRCVKLGTLKKGIRITQEMAPFPGDDKRNFLCFTMELNSPDGLKGNFCVSNDYDSSWITKEKKILEDGKYVKCNYGEKCQYSNGRNKFLKDCECGYNNLGQGYCPVPSGKNLEAWTERAKFIANSANNNCHSLSRFDCYTKNNYKFYLEQRYHESKTSKAHLFYNSVDCAIKMFGEQTNLKLNFSFTLLLLSFLILI